MERIYDLQAALDEISDILLELTRGNAVHHALERTLFEDGLSSVKEKEMAAALHAVASRLYAESTGRLRDLFNTLECQS